MKDEDEMREIKKRLNKLEEAVFQESDKASTPDRGKRISLAEFMRDYEASSHKETVLVVARYLENHEGQANFSSADIEDYYRKAKIKPPANPTDIISKSAGDGYIMEDGEENGMKKWMLTRTGEQKVENLKVDEDE